MGRRYGAGRCRQIIKYEPLPSQARFHELQARFKGFSGPVGSGKSQALCHEAIKLSYLNAGRTGLIGAPTYPMLRDATQASFLELLTSNDIPFDHNRAENVIVLKDVRSRILFRALEEFERLRGTNLSWFGVDELTYTPEEAWLRLEGRLRDPKATRLCGFAVWTPKGYDWVYRRFIAGDRAGYSAVQARPNENQYLLAQVPDFYDRLKTSYDELFYRQEALGEYLNVRAGRVYHTFDRSIHVREAAVDRNLPLLWALDFNVDPMCSVVAQMNGKVVEVIDEIVLPQASTANACEELRNRYQIPPVGIAVYGDASGEHMQTSGTSDYEIIRRFFARIGTPNVRYKVPKSNPPVRERVGLMNGKFRNAAGDAELFIDARCKELILDLEQVVYKPGTQVIDKDDDPKRTHLSDALGYLIWQECSERPTIGGRNRRIL
ncbi:MAG: hypothetical protein HY235_01195 [Acidobacteria bacterium]|nr:hypothetical protein [Acidobacteriota bacterium]